MKGDQFIGWIKQNLTGILFTFILAFAASWLGTLLPIIGAPVFGILIGIIINNFIGKPKSTEKGITYSFKKIFPWFIIWFLVASLLNTIGIFTGNSVHYINIIGKFMIVMALTAIGLNSDFKKMLKTGVKPIILGFMVWFIVAGVGILVQYISGQV